MFDAWFSRIDARLPSFGRVVATTMRIYYMFPISCVAHVPRFRDVLVSQEQGLFETRIWVARSKQIHFAISADRLFCCFLSVSRPLCHTWPRT